ncbi:GntR family transcriptional regulator [Streptomyces sp. NPDC006012]|uniref:GntR family transcriptional regulator n=1 Tax=Streptomyces sp. NPDC006012 TaxID=3364739 RepID=UPI0036C4C7DB
MPGNGAVTRSTLRQQIADALRDEVLAGRLQPGLAFTVKEIADQYGVSATPVREALVDLSAQGILEADQHRGFRVPQYSLTDFRGMVAARSLVTDGMFRALSEESDGSAAADGSERAEGSAGSGGFEGHEAFRDPTGPRAAAALAAVRRRGEEAERAARAGELTVLIGYDLRFWRELGALFGNPYLSGFLHRLRLLSWMCAVQHLRRLPEVRGLLWSGHTELVDALGRRDAAAARAVVTAYNAHSLALIERLAAR